MSYDPPSQGAIIIEYLEEIVGLLKQLNEKAADDEPCPTLSPELANYRSAEIGDAINGSLVKCTNRQEAMYYLENGRKVSFEELQQASPRSIINYVLPG